MASLIKPCQNILLSKPLKRQSQLQQTTLINIFSLFSEKIRLDVSSESSAGQRIHMKNQALFSSKDKCKKLKCRLLEFSFDALRAKIQLQLTLVIQRTNISKYLLKSKTSLNTYSRTSMARTPLGPRKLVRDRGSSANEG